MNRKPFLDRLKKNLPSLFSALALAVAVWILAVTNTDPVERRGFGPVEIELFGLDTTLVIINQPAEQTTIMLNAPRSTWASELQVDGAVRAVADLSGLTAGQHTVPVNLQIDAQPVKVETYSPNEIEVNIEEIYSESFTIELIQPSSPSIGYEAGNPVLSRTTAAVKGPSSLVDQVVGVRAVLDISQAKENIDTDLELRSVDENGLTVGGIAISPAEINVKMEITQRGGYRNVPVKVATSGQIKSGYRLTDISSNPLVVTLFSTDTDLINNLPGFIETAPLNLADASEDMVVSLPLNLQSGLTVVGESTIKVSVSIAPIQGSLTLNDLPVETDGLDAQFAAVLSPEAVDIILSGPLPTLDELTPDNVRIFIDLAEVELGTFQLEPSVEINLQGVLVQSLLPASIEVEIALPTAESVE